MRREIPGSYLFLIILLAAMFFIVPSYIHAQEGPAGSGPDASQPAGPEGESTSPGETVQVSVGQPESVVVTAEGETVEVPSGLSSPLRTYNTYRNAMQRAAEGYKSAQKAARDTLDLSDISTIIRQERGNELALQLARIFDYSPTIDLGSFPDTTDGPPVILIQRPEGSIVISKGADGAWRFNRDTVQAIPAIYHAMELAGEFEALDPSKAPDELLSVGDVQKDLGLRGLIPQRWKKVSFLIETWQWLFILVILVIGYFVYRLIPGLVAYPLVFWLRRLLRKTDVGKLVAAIARPFGLLALSLVWWELAATAGLNETLLTIIIGAAKLLLALSVVWIFYEAVDIITEYLKYRADVTGRSLDPAFTGFISGAMKLVAAVIGIILVLSNMGVNVTGLVAGLGIGGLALALAAKEPIENTLGSLIILMDRPFRIGDWVLIDKDEGVVEAIGFRSTRIRTFYNSVITISNAELARVRIDNYGVRHARRVLSTISVSYSTPPGKIDAFCAGIRELIRVYPYTMKERYFVWFDNFGPSSIDINLICHLRVGDFASESREKHRLFVDIMRLAQSLGVEFAFPTQTIFMGKETNPQPVFPETGDIYQASEAEMSEAERIAREIARSELGKESIRPEYFDIQAEDEVDD